MDLIWLIEIFISSFSGFFLSILLYWSFLSYSVLTPLLHAGRTSDMFWSQRTTEWQPCTNVTHGEGGPSQASGGTWQGGSHVATLTGMKHAGMECSWIFLHDLREPLRPGSIWQGGLYMKVLGRQETERPLHKGVESEAWVTVDTPRCWKCPSRRVSAYREWNQPKRKVCARQQNWKGRAMQAL